jgi:type II secretory pathway pseudopilin PulG
MATYTYRKKKSGHAGFTLAEIALATFLLSISLVTIIGLQSAIIGSNLRDRNMQNAMLLARRILAFYEANIRKPDIQDRTLTARNFLEDFGLRDIDIGESANDFNVRLQIQEWNLPMKEKALKRIILSVFWSDRPGDGVSVFYVVPYTDDSET